MFSAACGCFESQRPSILLTCGAGSIAGNIGFSSGGESISAAPASLEKSSSVLLLKSVALLASLSW